MNIQNLQKVQTPPSSMEMVRSKEAKMGYMERGPSRSQSIAITSNGPVKAQRLDKALSMRIGELKPSARGSARP